MCVLQSVAREIERAEQAQALRKQSADGKQAADAAEWGAWMRRYLARLQRERAAGTDPEQCIVAMNAVNPFIVLRNWVAQVAIERAEAGDYSLVRRMQVCGCLLDRAYALYHPAWCSCVHATCPAR